MAKPFVGDHFSKRHARNTTRPPNGFKPTDRKTDSAGTAVPVITVFYATPAFLRRNASLSSGPVIRLEFQR